MGMHILNPFICQQRGRKKVNQLTSTRREEGYMQGVGGGDVVKVVSAEVVNVSTEVAWWR